MTIAKNSLADRRCGHGDSLILLAAAATDADRANDLAIDRQRHPAGKIITRLWFDVLMPKSETASGRQRENLALYLLGATGNMETKALLNGVDQQNGSRESGCH